MTTMRLPRHQCRMAESFSLHIKAILCKGGGGFVAKVFSDQVIHLSCTALLMPQALTHQRFTGAVPGIFLA